MEETTENFHKKIIQHEAIVRQLDINLRSVFKAFFYNYVFEKGTLILLEHQLELNS